MREVKIDDFNAFVSHIDIYDGLTADTIIYRGQSKRGNLLPSIARNDPKKNTAKTEERMLQQLKLMGATFLPENDKTLLDTMVIAQHYGMKTRLLDWTRNPLAALWFACSSPKPGDVYVYALEANELYKEDLYSRKKDPLTYKKTRVVQPRLNNQNIIAQDGWFTLHCYSEKVKQFVPLEKNKEMKYNLTEFQIPGGTRQDMLHMLGCLGVNRRTLFPSLEGLCRHLNQIHNI